MSPEPFPPPEPCCSGPSEQPQRLRAARSPAQRSPKAAGPALPAERSNFAPSSTSSPPPPPSLPARPQRRTAAPPPPSSRSAAGPALPQSPHARPYAAAVA